ncbi:MAG TPA: Gfo/Idh/MocA family oxidoreductase [Tepidisphaeraceae bacterium]|jgi:predicted dehydrogenase
MILHTPAATDDGAYTSAMAIGVAIIGVGQIALQNHLAGIALSPQARVVALCDSDPAALAAAGMRTGVRLLLADYREAVNHPEVQAVVVATPNVTHAEIVRAAIAAGRHVLCEKPLALDYVTACDLAARAERAGVRNMTAFTYRFVPAMRYMKHLVDAGAVGVPYHFRAQRFQDWQARPLGWRQVKALAGSGEMGDMLSHRIDYAHLLVGPVRRLVAQLRNYLPERGGRPSDVDDWAAILCEFESTASGMLESTKLATGRGEGIRGQDTVELNGADGTIVYSTQRPLELRISKSGDSDLQTIEVPRAFRVWPGSPRDPDAGDPLMTFRYDQGFEFIDAITNGRPCRPGFEAGAEAQLVMDAADVSSREQRWVDFAPLRQSVTGSEP